MPTQIITIDRRDVSWLFSPSTDCNSPSTKIKNSFPFLRDTLLLTSVKNGCSEGACGTCMVLIDGKATKACIQQTDKLDGKTIVTVEGLSPREKDVYAYAFASAGAVQCGFCTPGMVISAKGLLDQNPNPTRADVKEAIKNNICRCTGYKKIEDAVLPSHRSSFGRTPQYPQPNCPARWATASSRIEVVDKTLGTALYADDIHLPGMLLGFRGSQQLSARKSALHRHRSRKSGARAW